MHEIWEFRGTNRFSSTRGCLLKDIPLGLSIKPENQPYTQIS